jgi:ABC-type lipoprotein release transport system permease subunit
MDDAKIRIAFTFESFGIGLVGSFFGLILGLALNVWIIYAGIDMNAFLGDVNMGYRVSGIIRGMWNPPGMILSLIFGSTFPMVIAWFTSKRAVRSEITDALRHV